MNHEEATYYSSGNAVRAWFFAGRDLKRPGPGVVFCPGFTGTKYAAFYEPYFERLTAMGCSVLAIDYRGWGDSAGERGLLVPAHQVEDIRNGLSYLADRPDVDEELLGVVGVSFGGGNAVYVAGIDRRVKCCVAISPVADGERWLRDMRRLYEYQELLDRLEEDRLRRVKGEPPALVVPTEDILVSTPERRRTTVKGKVPADKLAALTPLWCAEEIRNYRPYMVAGEIAPRALLLFAVQGDVVVATSHSQAIFSNAKEPKKLVMLPPDGHYGAYVSQLDSICGHMTDWLSTHLGPDGLSRPTSQQGGASAAR